MTLEICCSTINSCLIAAENGASRIELCSNPSEGGTTCSPGMLKSVRKLVNIPVFPIIRSRGGDFNYSKDDINAMTEDVKYCKELGFEGVVVGFLNKDGSVDGDTLQKFVDLAYPLDVTFHRAFDRSNDPFAAMEIIIGSGCQRILTSGLKPTVDTGSTLISELINKAANRIIIMPGSGVRSSNIAALAHETSATEFHSSARIRSKSQMEFINHDMQEDLSIDECDGEEIRKMRNEL